MSDKSFDPKEYLDVLSVRLIRDSYLSRPGYKVCSPKDAVKLAGDWIRSWDRECVAAIYLKTSGEVAGMHIASIGAINQSIVSPAEIIRCGLLCNAARFILLHNHPSGSIEPSEEDTAVTDRMIKAGNLMNMPLLDHVIVGAGNERYFSFYGKTDIPLEFNEQAPDDYHDLDWSRLNNVAEKPVFEETTTAVRRTGRHR